MRESSRVPPSRRSPDGADRPGDEALAASPAPGEPSPETAGPADASQAGRDEPAGLPHRVRGSNGLRPPVRVDRPTFSDSMLERVRAAVAAETDGDPDEPAPSPEPAEHVDLFGSPGRPKLPLKRPRKPSRKRRHRPPGRSVQRVPKSHLRRLPRHFP